MLCSSASIVAPASRRHAGFPFVVGSIPQSAGRSMPRMRPRRSSAAAMVAPVLPAETTASASPCFTSEVAMPIDVSARRRSALAGCSSIATTLRRSRYAFLGLASQKRCSFRGLRSILSGAGLLQPDEPAEEEVLSLRHRSGAAVTDRYDEQTAGRDVRDLGAIGGPRRIDVVHRRRDGAKTGVIALHEVEIRGDAEVRVPRLAADHPRRAVPRGGEHEPATRRREARGLQIEPLVLAEERPRVTTVDVRGPKRVGLSFGEVDVDQAIGRGRDAEVATVDQQLLALASPKIHSLDRVVIAYVLPALDDPGRPLEIEDVAGRIEARRAVEDVV